MKDALNRKWIGTTRN